MYLDPAAYPMRATRAQGRPHPGASHSPYARLNFPDFHNRIKAFNLQFRKNI